MPAPWRRSSVCLGHVCPRTAPGTWRTVTGPLAEGMRGRAIRRDTERRGCRGDRERRQTGRGVPRARAAVGGPGRGPGVRGRPAATQREPFAVAQLPRRRGRAWWAWGWLDLGHGHGRSPEHRSPPGQPRGLAWHPAVKLGVCARLLLATRTPRPHKREQSQAGPTDKCETPRGGHLRPGQSVPLDPQCLPLQNGSSPARGLLGEPNELTTCQHVAWHRALGQGPVKTGRGADGGTQCTRQAQTPAAPSASGAAPPPRLLTDSPVLFPVQAPAQAPGSPRSLPRSAFPSPLPPRLLHGS